MAMTAAISAKRSTQSEMLVMGSRAGGGGRPGTGVVTSVAVTSEISTNSRSRIFFRTFGASAAAGLNGPGCASSPAAAVSVVRDCSWDVAAAASMSRLPTVAAEVENTGREGRVGRVTSGV